MKAKSFPTKTKQKKLFSFNLRSFIRSSNHHLSPKEKRKRKERERMGERENMSTADEPAPEIMLFGRVIQSVPSHPHTKQRPAPNPPPQSPAPDSKAATEAGEGDEARVPAKLPCPRCSSKETKFCYFNNYNVNQPRHFCRSCRRYWTAGGALRNVPVGSGSRGRGHAHAHARSGPYSNPFRTERWRADSTEKPAGPGRARKADAGSLDQGLIS